MLVVPTAEAQPVLRYSDDPTLMSRSTELPRLIIEAMRLARRPGKEPQNDEMGIAKSDRPIRAKMEL
jgi:hypothetical protein